MTQFSLADMARAEARQNRRDAVRRFALIAFRAFWRSFWRSAGWCIPIILALEWFARHRP